MIAPGWVIGTIVPAPISFRSYFQAAGTRAGKGGRIGKLSLFDGNRPPHSKNPIFKEFFPFVPFLRDV